LGEAAPRLVWLVVKNPGRITAACVDMWEPFTASILSWAPECRIVYDKFHIMQHAS
jgi:transposase